MDERFLESVVHKRAPFLARWRGYSGHVVLGARLRPFSIWHQELLQGIESPFLSVWQKQPTSIELFNALYLATRVCRLSAFDSVTSHFSPLTVLRRKALVFRFYFRLGLRRPGTRLLVLLKEAAKFRGYLADYGSLPIPFPNMNSKRIQTPVSAFQVATYARFHPGLSVRAIWNKSPGEIAWANVAAQEAAGNEVSLMTKEREEARAAAMQPRKKKKKASPSGNGSGKRF